MNRSYIIFRITAIIIPLCFFSGCESLFDSGSEEKTREISLDDFNTARIYTMCNLILVQDTVNYLVLSGEEKNINSVETSIEKDTLIIKDKSKFRLFNKTGRPTIYMHFKKIRSLWVHEPADISNLDTIRLDVFSVFPIGEIGEVDLTVDCEIFVMHCSANTLGYLHVKGKAGLCQFFNRYGCTFFADSLHAKNAEIINESIGDVFINASEKLSVYLWGNGNIYYYGSPEIEIKEKRGAGEVISIH